ncbi:hypothetical protein FOF52_06165 [Thermobifida alba]|uniref:Uncharacterized protein n=1 Tax=Thermobifida alba TaxID=53522 RepID=A0ABY4L2W3_THEAE|nr:hypothetical protein [Thermobifida alba]UPT20600.1 hypothetical protein FOF52_06165 [Thermobifida alba]HLU99552.1 hypothetical protein [Thermobifida alba]
MLPTLHLRPPVQGLRGPHVIIVVVVIVFVGFALRSGYDAAAAVALAVAAGYAGVEVARRFCIG